MTKKNKLSTKSTQISTFKKLVCIFGLTLFGSLSAQADTIYTNGWGVPMDQTLTVGSDCYVHGDGSDTQGTIVNVNDGADGLGCNVGYAVNEDPNEIATFVEERIEEGSIENNDDGCDEMDDENLISCWDDDIYDEDEPHEMEREITERRR